MARKIAKGSATHTRPLLSPLKGSEYYEKRKQKMDLLSEKLILMVAKANIEASRVAEPAMLSKLRLKRALISKGGIIDTMSKMTKITLGEQLVQGTLDPELVDYMTDWIGLKYNKKELSKEVNYWFKKGNALELELEDVAPKKLKRQKRIFYASGGGLAGIAAHLGIPLIYGVAALSTIPGAVQSMRDIRCKKGITKRIKKIDELIKKIK